MFHPGAVEEPGVGATEEPHRVDEHEIPEIVTGHEAFVDQLVGFGHHPGHVDHIEMTDVGAIQCLEGGTEGIGFAIEGDAVHTVVGLAAEIERVGEQWHQILRGGDVATGVVIQLVDASGHVGALVIEQALSPTEAVSQAGLAVAFGQRHQRVEIQVIGLGVLQRLEVALLPMADQIRQ